MIAQNISNIRQRIAYACSKIKQDPQAITIVAVAKNRTVEQIRQAIEAGITDIGENRIQEAALKYNAVLRTPYSVQPKWHMVGHLQTNKVKEAVKIFDLIHSVDSIRLAAEINAQAANIDKIQDILVQVNTAGEATKFGLKPDAVIEVITEISKLANIKIKGLMTIAPLTMNPEHAQPCFRKLRESLDKVNAILNTQYAILSMGMSDDFEVAIEEGATMLRLGRGIFGA